MSLQKRYKVLYLLIIISMLLSLFIVKVPTQINITTTTLYISAIAGYSGIMLLLWNFVLGTRSVSTLFFKDYAKTIKLHSWIGKYGTLLIFLHPILVMISYSKSLFFVILPSFSSEFENAITYGRAALWIILVIWISSALLKSKVSYRPWKYLHLGAYISIPFALLHVPDTGSSYAASISAKLYFFTVVIGFLIFLAIRLRGALNLNKSKYSISLQKEVSPEVFVIQLTPQSIYQLTPKPGQYIYIKRGWFSEDHPFSVLDHDATNGVITLGYKIYGAFTKKLSKVTAGSILLVSGPFGYFTQDININPVVYIAGGIGVTPFMSRILHENNKREQWLFYTNRTFDSAAFEASLRQSLKDRYVPIYSREEYLPTIKDEFGYIKSEMFIKYLSDPKAYSYYICGPQTMIKTVTKELEQLGISEQSIHQESFNF